MLRTRAASLAAVALLVAGCGAAEPPADQTAGAALQPSCPAPVRPPAVTADLLNRIVAQADLPGWQAADIGASTRLADGRLVWVFGDTVRRPELQPRLVANSMLVSSGTCVSQLVTPDHGPVVPDDRDGTVHWPMSVVALPPSAALGQDVDEVVLVLCARTRRGAGSLDFQFRGTTAAVFTVGHDGVPRLSRTVEVSPDDADRDQINWGAAATVDGNWLYVYGTRSTGEPYVFGRELYVARLPVDDPGDRGTWRFWDGTGWRAESTRAAAVLGAVGGVSQTLSVDAVDGRWTAVSKRDGDLGDFVYTWSAQSPTGPWVPRRALRAPAGYDAGRLAYAPLAHPEISLASGALLVSISHNTTDAAQLLADPELGRPVFVEVPAP
jgi:hypothetical protein